MSIIVNDGKVLLQQSQITYLETLYMTLFVNNVSEGPTVVWGSLTEASWTGYARVLASSWSAASLVSSKGQSVGPPCSFTNTSGSSQTYYGWAVYDNSAGKLLGFANLGIQTLINGGTITYTPTITDDQA